MSRVLAVRESALLVSVMQPGPKALLLASLPSALKLTLLEAVRVVEDAGWNRPEVVARALEDTGATSGSDDQEQMRRLLRLAGCVDSATFSRVMAASELSDAEFLLSMLDPAYATEVAGHLRTAPKMPEQLRRATLASVHLLLEDATARSQ